MTVEAIAINEVRHVWLSCLPALALPSPGAATGGRKGPARGWSKRYPVHRRPGIVAATSATSKPHDLDVPACTSAKRPAKRRAFIVMVAERMGFEPMVECYPHTRLAGEHLQPTRSSLRMGGVAEGVGFEPTEVLPSTVFKTAAFDHSAIPPIL